MSLTHYRRRAAYAGLGSAVINAGYRNRDTLGRAAHTIGRAARRWLDNRRAMSTVGASQQTVSVPSSQTSRKRKRVAQEQTLTSRSTADPLGGSVSKFSLVRPKVNLGGTDALTTDQNVVVNGSGRIASLVGKQEGGILLTELTPTQIQTLFNNTFGSSNKTVKGLIKSCVSEIMFVNQENTPCNYTLYDIVPRKDGNATVTDPYVAFSTGGVDPTGGAAANYVVPGYDPFMNPRFTEYFTVIKKTHGTLLPGNVHTHKSYYEPNKVISNEISSFTSSYVNGLTHFTMVVFHGTPINDSSTVSQVSLAPIAIDYVVKTKISTKIVYYTVQSVTVTHSLPTAFGVHGEFMNEFTGAPEADAVA